MKSQWNNIAELIAAGAMLQHIAKTLHCSASLITSR
jgi:hypothetical protein